MLKDFLSAGRNEIDKRIRHPFLFPFFLTLITSNYKLFLVISSDEDYRLKFGYIENVLYPSIASFAAHFLLYPIGIASLVVFAWPRLEKWILAEAVRLENQTKLRILEQQEKTPIDSDLQAEFFEQLNAEKEDMKRKLSAARAREMRLSKEHTEKLLNVRTRLTRQALRRLAESPKVENKIISTIATREYWYHEEMFSDLREALQGSRLIPLIARFVQEATTIPPDSNFSIVASMQWLAHVTGTNTDYATDLYEVLTALGLAGELHEDQQTFEIYLLEPGRLNGFRSIPLVN